MTMGVQRALKAAFGDQLEEVVQVEEEGGIAPGGEGREMTVAGVDTLLALLRPAVANYGGNMEVLDVEGGLCRIRYSGPDAIWTVRSGLFLKSCYVCFRGWSRWC